MTRLRLDVPVCGFCRPRPDFRLPGPVMADMIDREWPARCGTCVRRRTEAAGSQVPASARGAGGKGTHGGVRASLVGVPAHRGRRPRAGVEVSNKQVYKVNAMYKQCRRVVFAACTAANFLFAGNVAAGEDATACAASKVYAIIETVGFTNNCPDEIFVYVVDNKGEKFKIWLKPDEYKSVEMPHYEGAEFCAEYRDDDLRAQDGACDI